MKHTPGPWKWVAEPGASSLIGPGGDEDCVLLYADYEGLALYGRPNDKGFIYESEQANARLIAAAPTLFDAAQKTADDMEKWFDGGLRPDEWKLREWVDALRTAIAKATGE